MEFIQNNVSYPEEARKKEIEDKVYVQFIVEKNGSLSHIEVINDVHPILKEEALLVLSEMPDWEPGTQKGRPVRVEVRIPINFKLE